MNDLAHVHWQDEFAALAHALSVETITPRHAEYDSVRVLYNRMHDHRPEFIVRTLDAAAIGRMLRFACKRAIPVAMRGGGHHIAGFGSCTDGIVFDFSTFRAVRVDAVRRTVEVEPGARLGDVDRELARHKLVIPSGTVSETGIAGLTLGGGIGWLVGYFGLTCDHLIGADLVTAHGDIVRAEDDKDLLWALRGGGGNFGVVTMLRYRAEDMPHFLAGTIAVAPARTREALGRVVDYMVKGCPPALTIAPTLTEGPDGATLAIDFCLVGYNPRPLERLHQAVGESELRLHANPHFPSWQSAFDHLFDPPMRGYWKSRYSAKLSGADLDAIVSGMSGADPGDVRRLVTIEHLHGNIRRQPSGESAFPLRDANFGVLIAARWPHAELDALSIAWVREFYATLDPNGASPSYSNYSGADDDRSFASLQDIDRQRLGHVKRKYDPHNLFKRNHTLPAAQALP